MSTVVSHFFCSSIGRKQVIALTGLMLCGFLIGHLLGNFLLIAGPEAFNIYAHKLVSLGAGLYAIEAVLAAVFLTHLGLAFKLTIENKKARPQKYLMKTRTGRGETFMSASVPYTGIILLIFMIKHMFDFKFGTLYYTNIGGVEMRDLYATVIEYFKSPGAVLWYVVAMTSAGLHTSHGFSSAFQSLGLNHPKYFKKLRLVAYLYAGFIALGFSAIAICCHLKGGAV